MRAAARNLALLATALAALVAAPAAAEPPEPSANVLRIAPGGIAGRFVAPPTVRAGESLEVVNQTDPKKVGPHSLSLVIQSALPQTPQARQSCFAPNRLCHQVARWHRLDLKTGRIGTPLVDVGPQGWSTMGSRTKTGDSWFTDHRNESITRPITAKPQTLHFFCLIHPWMQGETKVLSPT